MEELNGPSEPPPAAAMSTLKIKIKELSHQAAVLSRQALETSKVNRKQGLDLMRQARDASKRCQALIQELKRQQAA